jgi:LAGLIDADG endonuclease
LIDLFKSKTHKTGFAVKLKFSISQHSRDAMLLKNLVGYFGCGNYFKSSGDKLIGSFTVQNFSDITEKIIPFLNKYPVLGIKSKDFEDFCKVAELMRNKEHLTLEGLGKIRKIKSGMNRGRDDI